MQNFETLMLAPLLVAAVISFAVTPLVIRFAWRWRLVDDPKKNKHEKVLHTKTTPRGGGLAIFIAFTIATLLFLPFDKHIAGILAGATILVATGLLDDKYNLNPYLRLLLQFLAAGMPIIAGIGIAFISNPFGGIIDLSNPSINFWLLGEYRTIWIVSDLFALLWIVTIMNFLNMGAKGVDGQLTGVVAIAAITIALLSFQFSADIAEWPVIILASIVAGSFMGFLPWHIYPQRIMPSFAGSNLAGFLLAVLSILSTTKVGTLTVVLGVPLIDTTYVIVRRVRAGRSPVWGDRGHLHHRLLDSKGWSKRSVAYFYWTITLILGLLALNLNTATKFYTIIGVILLIGGLIAWLTKYKK